ncbi:MAG TPA: lipopolysaccharide biosynthesis protein, partial [Chloroflexota bacterium]|nr:lipopolysaccharide biosynthesis protein [Chloroflexota bacterium]
SNLIPGAGYLVRVFVFTRTFERGPFGLYVLSMAIAAPTIGLLTQWILRPSMRFYAEYQGLGKGDMYREVLASLNLRLMLLVMLIGAATAIPLWASGWLGGHAVLASGVFVFVLGSVPATNALAVVRSSLRPGSFFGVTVLAEIVSIGVPLVFVFTVSRDIGWLAWGQALAVWIALPYTLVLTGITPSAARLRLSPEARRIILRFARYGTPMVLWWAGANLLSLEDRYVLEAFRGSSEVAVYGVNYDFISAASTLLNGTLVLGFGPVLYHHWAQGRRSEVAKAIGRTTDLYFFLGLGFIGGVIAVGPAIETFLMGANFRAGLPLLVPVAAGTVFFGLSVIGHKTLELGEGMFAMATGAIIAGAVNLALNLALVPRYGYIASADASACCYALYAALIWWQSRRYVQWEIHARPFIQAIAVAAAATVAALLAELSLNRDSLARLTVGTSAYVAVFVLLVLAAQRQELAQTFGARASRRGKLSPEIIRRLEVAAAQAAAGGSESALQGAWSGAAFHSQTDTVVSVEEGVESESAVAQVDLQV